MWLLKQKHVIYFIRKWKWSWKWSCSVVSNSLQPHGHQAPPSVGFSRQEYWSQLPFPSLGILPNPGIEPRSPCIVDRRFTIWATREVYISSESMPKLLYPVNMFIGFNNLYLFKVINCLQNVYIWLTVPHNSSVR